MYVKRWIMDQFSPVSKQAPEWVEWVHINTGKSHCGDCLALDGRWFLKEKAPVHPHHLFCHCVLNPVDYAVVTKVAKAKSAYSKFDPYLFDPEDFYKHRKNIMFEGWGYTVKDSLWLQEEIQRQAQAKYLAGDYKLGKLNEKGQRISIRVEIPNRKTGETVTFITGWTVHENGLITLNTPYGGK